MEKRYHDKDWLYNEYVVNGRTINDICEEFGVKHQSVERYLKRYDIRKRPREVKLPTAQELYKLHVEEEKSITKIVDMYPGVGKSTILRIMTENGIEIIPSNILVSKWWANLENKEKMSAKRLKLWQDNGYRSKTMQHLKDKNAIMERAIKNSARYQGISVEEWDGFLTPQQTRIRGSKKYAIWRNAVFQRDNYTCQCCGARSHSGHPVILHAHHLENFAHNKSLRFDIENGITLCYNCHDIRVHGSFHNLYGIHGNTRVQFEEYMTSRRNKDIDDEEEIGKYFANGEIIAQKQTGFSDL